MEDAEERTAERATGKGRECSTDIRERGAEETVQKAPLNE